MLLWSPAPRPPPRAASRPRCPRRRLPRGKLRHCSPLNVSREETDPSVKERGASVTQVTELLRLVLPVTPAAGLTPRLGVTSVCPPRPGAGAGFGSTVVGSTLGPPLPTAPPDITGQSSHCHSADPVQTPNPAVTRNVPAWMRIKRVLDVRGLDRSVDYAKENNEGAVKRTQR